MMREKEWKVLSWIKGRVEDGRVEERWSGGGGRRVEGK